VERRLVRAVTRLEVGGGASAAGLLVLGHECVLLSSRHENGAAHTRGTLRAVGCDHAGFPDCQRPGPFM
jgi:hypothetical protein